MKIHLGVHDISYAAQFHSRTGKAKRAMSRAQAAYGKNATTGDVAEIIEAKYHLMETFVGMIKPEIDSMAAQSIGGTISNILAGQKGPILPTSQATSDIETKFKQMLSARAFDGKIKGVPTRASLDGVSHRFKKPYAKRPSRPSFVDTGAYQSSFTVWVE